MKITKVLYLLAALLAVNFIAPSFYNNVVDAKKASYKKLTPAERKKRNQKIMMISSIASGIAVLLGTALGLGFHYKGKRGNRRGTPAAKKEPILGALNNKQQNAPAQK
ncbi:hypothetical protein AK88_01323 [Plasmodium fragile]|uniref:Early transcribed membrane protein n=1 Tax=Plasmodium fragile TaxID=5857 RepID=A0A0D9QTL5_PLAFR|nr:uncharacterized protein AK88_01323 [Plasmodium fragile]KJP89031.1 hypothetical protein AK88_01323 [Plasmodium fragile]